MIQSVTLLVTISMSLLALVKSYDFTTKSCSAASGQQSPINIDPAQSLYFDEKYFRFLSNSYTPLTTENQWKYLEEEKAIGITPTAAQKTFGSFILVKDWSMYNFNLDKILFRVGSEHKINGQTFDAEMQLVHSIDTNYYAPGRRVNLGVSYLVISIFFQKTEDTNPARSKLFDFMNLSGFASANATDVFMHRSIKLHHIVQHQPSYLYKGSLTFPECEPALWLLFSQYHLISASDLTKLTTAIQAKTSITDSVTRKNTRDAFPVASTTPIYRNWNELDKLTARPTLMSYSSGAYLHFTFVSFIGFVFLLAMIFF